MNMFKGSEAKTAEEYLDQVPDERQEAVRTVHDAIVKAVPKLKPHMISGMLAYGTYHYRSKSGREGDWALVMMANRKDYVSVYICATDGGEYIAEKNKDRLGKVSVGKSCIRFKRLEDINLDVLAELCKKAEKAGDSGDFAIWMIDEIKAELRALANPEKAAFFPRFFKAAPGEYAEGDKFLGVTVPNQRTLAKKYFKLLTLAETIRLLQSPWHEERLTALFILVIKYQKGNQSTKNEIFDLYLENTEYVNNWDLVDSSADRIVGDWLDGNDYKTKVLEKLARSDGVWERRIAMLATFHYIKQGRADEAIVIATILLHDEHDLIQKAVGWMLREIGKRVDTQTLKTFLDQHADSMPRTTLRYAIEHFAPPVRKHYMRLKNA